MSEKLSNPPSPVLVWSSMLALIMLVLIGMGYGIQALHTNGRANRFETFFGFRPEKEHRRQAEVDAHLKHKMNKCLDITEQYIKEARAESRGTFRLKVEVDRVCDHEKHSEEIAHEFGYK